MFKVAALIPFILAVFLSLRSNNVFAIDHGSIRRVQIDSSEIYTVLREIVLLGYSGKFLTRELHGKFYQMVDKLGLTDAQVDEVLSVFSNKDAYLLQKYFFEDALITIGQGQMYRSDKRRLLEESLISREAILNREEIMQKILEGKSIKIEHEELVLNQEICAAILENLDFMFLVSKRNSELLRSRIFIDPN